jgi:hypothetical protein
MGRAGSVFINYRRDDSGWAANAVGEALRQRLGPDQVYLDNSSIELGRRFARVITDAVRRSDALIALIGPRWEVPPLGDRLADPDDWVRQEILMAKKADILIVPVLVDRTKEPLATALPTDLQFLPELQRAVIRQDHPEDVEILVERLTSRPRMPERSAAVGVERNRAALDQYLRRLLPQPNQWSGNRERLVELTLAVLGPRDRLLFIAPCRVHDGPRGSAAVLVTGSDVIVVEVGEDFLIRGEIRLPLAVISRVEAVTTLPLFADVVIHTGSGQTVRLQGLFRGQARQLADHLRA